MKQTTTQKIKEYLTGTKAGVKVFNFKEVVLMAELLERAKEIIHFQQNGDEWLADFEKFQKLEEGK